MSRSVYRGPAETFDHEIQSWDLAFKDLETSDYVAGGVWGVKGADRYLLDQVRDRLGFPETVAAIKNVTLRSPKAGRKLVQDKADGPAVISALRHDISDLAAIPRNIMVEAGGVEPPSEKARNEENYVRIRLMIFDRHL